VSLVTPIARLMLVCCTLLTNGRHSKAEKKNSPRKLHHGLIEARSTYQ